MAKLRGEISRLEIDTADRSTDPDAAAKWTNIAGQMSTGVNFNAGTDVVNTLDNKTGASKYILTTANGAIEMNAKYPTDVDTEGDLIYKDFFNYSKAKTRIPARFHTPLFTIDMVLSVLNLNLNASNSASADYSVTFGYAEKPKFTPIKT